MRRPGAKQLVAALVGLALVGVGTLVVFVGCNRRSTGDYVRWIAGLPELGAPTYSFDDTEYAARARWHLSREHRAALEHECDLRRVTMARGDALPLELTRCDQEPCVGEWAFRPLEIGDRVLLGETDSNAWFGALYADGTFDVVVRYPDWGGDPPAAFTLSESWLELE